MAMTFSVEIDWEHDLSWTSETSRVRRAVIRVGFAGADDAVAGVGRCVLTLDNSDQRFSPDYAAGALYGKLLPRRAVRVKATDGTSSWTLFRGYVESITPDAGEWGGGECEIVAVDGLDILGRQMIGVAYETSKDVDAAVAAIVSAAYTPPATDYHDNGDTLEHYGDAWNPEETTCLEALGEVCRAVYGRFYVARDGTVTFWTRDDGQDSSAAMALMVGEYYERVLNTKPANLVAYWRLNESAGTDVDDASDNDYDGVATGVAWGQTGIGDGESAAAFDGVNDYINVYSVGLRDAFDEAAGTALVWVKPGSGYWTDSLNHIAMFLGVDSSANYVMVKKDNTDNRLEFIYYAGGIMSRVTVAGQSFTDWTLLALTWSVAADEVKAYVDGAQVGTTQTGLGTWAGSLASTLCCIGALNTTPVQPFLGDLAHGAVWDTALSAAEIAQLAGV